MAEPTKVIDLKSSPRAKVLVAEDEQDIASMIEDWLSEIYDVTVALNGKTAVQKAVWHQPQVVLLDVVMPDMGGYDVVRLLQGTPQTKGIPVIVMTAKNFDDSTIKMIKAEGNVYGFLNKPFKPSELIKMLEVVLKGGKALGPDGSPPLATSSSSPPLSSGGLPEIISSGFDVVKSLPDPPVEPSAAARGPEKGAGRAAPAQTPESVGGGPELPHPIPLRERPKGEADSSSFGLKKVLSVLTIVLAVGIIFVGGLFGVAEWTCRRAEVALGVAFFAPPIHPASRFNSFMPYQWNDPKLTAPSYWDDGRVVYQFNQWGLRGPEFPLVAPNGVRRILLLGGTRTFGLGVGEKDTLSTRLQTLLNEKRPGLFQVINGGLWALSPEEQWAFVKGQGFNFKPEAILWLCESREPGVPSTEGLHWLANHRWLVSAPFSDIRLIQMVVQNRIRGMDSPIMKEDDPLFRQAEELAATKKVALAYWILPRGATASAAFNESWLGRLSRALEKKSE